MTAAPWRRMIPILLACATAGCGRNVQMKLPFWNGEGVAMVGPIQFGEVSFSVLGTDGTVGDVLGPGGVASDGTFPWIASTDTPTGCVIAQVGSGGYVDDVSGETVMLDADAMGAVFCGDLPAQIAITPFSTMAASRAIVAAHDGTALDAAVETANAAVAVQYYLDSVVTELPVDPGSAAAMMGSTRQQREYGLLLGGLQQLAKTLGTRAIDLSTALAIDAKDGVLDGMHGSGPVMLKLESGASMPLPPSSGVADMAAAIGTFSASATNHTGLSGKRIARIAVSLGLGVGLGLGIASGQPPPFVSGSETVFKLSVAGGIPPYQFQVGPGALPPGLTLAGDGTLSGVTTLAGGSSASVSEVQVQVTDSSHPAQTVTVPTVITTMAPPPMITCAGALPPVQVGVPYQAAVADATGGSPPYYFVSDTFANGVPPIGLKVGPDGRLSGTPAADSEGDYSFGVCVVDLVGAESCCKTGAHVAKAAGPPAGGGTCAGGLLVSTLSCTPLGNAGTSPYCLSATEYMSVANQPLPAACAPMGTVGCLNGVSGVLVNPCCSGLTCRVSAGCGDQSNAVGGTCLP